MDNLKQYNIRDRKVLLFSGGLDSSCIAALEKPDVLLYIDHNAQSQQKESKIIKDYFNKYKHIFGNPVLIIDTQTLNLSQFELPDAKILLRNLFFVNLAALYGDNILLGVVKGDKNKDKDSSFLSLAQNTLNYCMQKQHWMQGYNYKLSCDYQDTSKSELVSMFLKLNHGSEMLFDSWSCYKNERHECNKCKPCLRKKEALQANNLL